MGAWVFRILAAVGAVTIIMFLAFMAAVYSEWIGEQWESQKKPAEDLKPDESLKLDLTRGYALMTGEEIYFTDAPDLDKAMKIVKLDRYGVWKTDRGVKGPWEMVVERHD